MNFIKRFKQSRRYYANKVKNQACRDYETRDQIAEVMTDAAFKRFISVATDAILWDDLADSVVNYHVDAYLEKKETAEAAAVAILEAYLDEDEDYNVDMYKYRNGVWYNGRAEWYKEIEIDNEDE